MRCLNVEHDGSWGLWRRDNRSGLDTRRLTRRSLILLHVMENDAPRAYLRIFSNYDITQKFGTSSNRHTLTDFGMAIPSIFPSTSEGNFVKNANLVCYLCCFSGYKSSCVVKINSASELGSGMDVRAENLARNTLKIQSQS